MTVQESERFHYQHIFDNLRMDVHPPLYFLILHMVRSFLPEGFDKKVGLALNAVILLLLLWWFYQLAMAVLKDKDWAFGATFFFAFLPIVLEMSLFVRMYLLEMAFFVGLLAQTMPLIEENKLSLKRAIKIFCFAVLCYLTHFYGLVYTFFLSAGICGYFLFKKKYDVLFFYSGVMLLSVGVVALLYPAFWEVILYSDRGVENAEAVSIFNWALMGALGEQMITEIVHAFFYIRCWVWLIFLGFIYLFWKSKISAIGWILLFTALGSMLLLSVIAPNMGDFNERYYVGSIAALYMAIVYALYRLMKNISHGGKIISILAVILAGVNFILMQYSPFLAKTSEIEKVTELVRGNKVLLQQRFIKTIFDLVPAFQNADAVYILFTDEDGRDIIQSEEFNKGSIVVYEAGIGAKKYKSKAFLAQNPANSLRFIGQYSVDLMCYDIYEKI